jgi:hypothetical protein
MVRFDMRRKPPRGVRRRTAFTDLDCEYFEHSDEIWNEERYGYGGYDPSLNPNHNSHHHENNYFQEISMRGMLQVLKRCRNRPADLVMAMDCSGNAQTALQNRKVWDALLPTVEKLITAAHTVRRFGLYVTGATEMVFPPQSLVSDIDTKEHLLAQWRELRDSNVAPLSSFALAVDIVGVGRFMAVKTISFQNRTDLHHWIVGNWSTEPEETVSPPAAPEAAPSVSEDSVPKNHVSLDEESLDESKYDMVQVEDDESWRDEGLEDWVDHASTQESWDGVSDVDSVLSLDDVQELYSYADMVRFGLHPDSQARQKALHHLAVPDLGSKNASTDHLPSILEDSVDLIVDDRDLRQQFLDLQEGIDLLLDRDLESAHSIDAFDAKYERRGRQGGARSDGTIRWKRFK